VRVWVGMAVAMAVAMAVTLGGCTTPREDAAGDYHLHLEYAMGYLQTLRDADGRWAAGGPCRRLRAASEEGGGEEDRRSGDGAWGPGHAAPTAHPVKAPRVGRRPPMSTSFGASKNRGPTSRSPWPPRCRPPPR